ncbi:hypothetical protein PVAP13_4NG177100 [Panicum virgatum]|uniref:Uncharacterized protein n=1 Tax=Panicum virgatum TaxID=38727 RepID=A0A8T0TEB2_PANVG|nr:hypothetical protein PVAP13_4NG177100 [Panicum virgatum]
MSPNTCVCLMIVVLSLLVLVISSSLTAGSEGGARASCGVNDPNNPCPRSCGPFSPSCH